MSHIILLFVIMCHTKTMKNYIQKSEIINCLFLICKTGVSTVIIQFYLPTILNGPSSVCTILNFLNSFLFSTDIHSVIFIFILINCLCVHSLNSHEFQVVIYLLGLVGKHLEHT